MIVSFLAGFFVKPVLELLFAETRRKNIAQMEADREAMRNVCSQTY